MRTIIVRRRIMIAGLLAAASIAHAATPAQKCQQGKNKEAGKYAYCRQMVEATFALLGDAAVRSARLQKCLDKFNLKWPVLEAKASAAGGACPSVGDQSTIRAAADGHTTDVAVALAGGPVADCPGDLATCEAALATCEATQGRPLTTGQTSCWDGTFMPAACSGTGQDGATQRGLTRSYTDNGDGTITDGRTGLMWEKQSSDASIHDQNDAHTWADAFAVKIATLNATAFAGHIDWRLPNQFELYSLLDLGAITPAVSAPFDTGCVPGCTVLTCSCTRSDFYWSSTTYEDGPAIAWYVDFSNGYAGGESKTSSVGVRAVRGGS